MTQEEMLLEAAQTGWNYDTRTIDYLKVLSCDDPYNFN